MTIVLLLIHAHLLTVLRVLCHPQHPVLLSLLSQLDIALDLISREPHFTKQFLILVGVHNLRASVVKCIAGNTCSFIFIASCSSLASVMVTVFWISCFLWLHLNTWMIPKSECCSRLVDLAWRNTVLMLLRNMFSMWAAQCSKKSILFSIFLSPTFLVSCWGKFC